MRSKKQFIAIFVAAWICLFILSTVTPTRKYIEFSSNAIQGPIEHLLETSDDTSQLEPICNQPNDPKQSVVILVSSYPDNFERRKAIRESWASLPEQQIYIGATATIFFVLGQIANKAIQSRVRTEAYDLNDILQGAFMDDYSNMTLKSLYGMRWVIENCGHRFLMKTDDDMWINTPNLIRYIKEVNKTENALLAGHVFQNAKPYRDKYYKYYMSHSDYPDDTYPDFLSGTSYLMTRTVLLALYKCATERSRVLRLEDVLITGICAEKLSLSLTNHPRFHFQKVLPCGGTMRRAITAHGYDPDELRAIWLAMYKDGYPFAKIYHPLCYAYNNDVKMCMVISVVMTLAFILTFVKIYHPLLYLVNNKL